MTGEHPELREVLHTFMAQFMERTYHTTVLYDFGGPLADALLAPAGPVGKLQALDAFVRRLVNVAEYDDEGAGGIVGELDGHDIGRTFCSAADLLDALHALAAGESAVTGEAT